LSANAEVDKFKRDLADSLGNGAPYIRAANSLVEAGYTDYDKLFAASNDELMDVDNVGNSMIASIRVLQRQLTPDLE
jgi:DNA-directed RNA polymerase alpha subunit